MNKETIFAGLVGFAVGGAVAGIATYCVSKKKYTDILNKTVDNYERLLDEAEAFEDDVSDEYKRYSPEDKSKDENEEPVPRFNEEEKEKIREKLRYNREKTTSYAAMYQLPIKDIIDSQAEAEKDAKTLSLAEAPDEPEENFDEEDEVEEAINIFKAAEEVKDRKPVLISEEDYNDICDNHSDEWDCDNIFLYNDGTLAQEDDTIIEDENVAVMFGDCLDKYGFKNSSEKTIFVKCWKLNTVYEIAKINKPFIK